MLEFTFRDLLGALDFHSRMAREYKGVVVQVSDRRVVVMSSDPGIRELALKMRGSESK